MDEGNQMLVAERQVPLGAAPRGFSGRIDALTTADIRSGVPKSSGVSSNWDLSRVPESKSCMRG